MKARGFPGLAAAALFVCATACTASGPANHAFFPFTKLRGQLFSPPQVLADAKRESFGDEPNAIVLCIDENSSFRAVTGAVLRLRERGLPVGYWIDVRGAPGSGADFDARLARARAVLEDRPAADAIFLAGLQGGSMLCGCREALCGVIGTADPREGARLVAALRGFTGSTIIVPVWSDTKFESQKCPAPDCIQASCDQRRELAWLSLRAESDRLALDFTSTPSEGIGFHLPSAGAPSEGIAFHVRSLLHGWSRLVPPAPLARSRPDATIIAVLPGLEWPSAELASAIAGIQVTDLGGFLVIHCSLD